jgi:lysophospholipase L1-like esterase
MAEILEAAAAVYPDGPGGTPHEPDKAQIRALFALVDAIVAEIRSLTAAGAQWKDPVRVATTANDALATAFQNGATVDGVVLATGDRILLKNQTTASQNGIYVVPATGAPTRAADADSGPELVGLAVFVREGATNGGKQFICSTPAPITVGTTALAFREASDQTALNANLFAEIVGRKAVIDEDGAIEGLEFRDQGGFISMRLSDDLGLSAPGYNLAQSNDNVFLEITDANGFTSFYVDASGVRGLLIDLGGEESFNDGYDATPMIGGTLYGFSGAETHLFPRNVLPFVSDLDRVQAAVYSDGSSDGTRPAFMRLGRNDLVLDLSKCGPTIQYVHRLMEREKDTREIATLNVRALPRNPATGTAVKVLLLGDSITNRAMGQRIKNTMLAHGYNPTFIGTIPGSGIGETSDGTSGPLGEAREGHEFGDFTGAIVDRALIVDPGGEASYLALSKAPRREYIPWLRASTGSDPAEFIRNSRIVDFSYYQTRFALAAPDVVLIGLGTNDIRDRDTSELVSAIQDGLTILVMRALAAWPSAKVLLWFPQFSRSTDRDTRRSRYASVLKGYLAFVRSFADARVSLVPTWAMASAEVGWAFEAGTTDDQGIKSASFSDTVHLGTLGQQQTAEILAAAIASVPQGTFI